MSEELLFECEIQVKIISEANNFEHWTKKRKRKLDQQILVRSALFDGFYNGHNHLPCKIILTRLYPRLLDDDNLVHCFKYIRDEIASFLCIEENRSGLFIKKGSCDNDPRMKWDYNQKKSKLKGIRIQIYQN